MNSTPIMAFEPTRTDNAQLMVDCRELGYLSDEDLILDPTWGKGRFWTKWHPKGLIGTDLNPKKSPAGLPIDFTALPYADRLFDAVVFDPPYKLNGTPSEGMDEDYGVDEPTRWQDRMALCIAGIEECARVSSDRLLVKCMDQVCSGRVRWQTTIFAEAGSEHGFRLVDELHVRSYREQPSKRRQVHARRNLSTLLVMRRAR